MASAYTPSVAPVPDQYFHDSHYRPSDHPSISTSGIPTPPESSRASIPPTPSENAIAGKKRSRGEMRDEDTVINESANAELPRGEPMYGPGMTLVYPNDLSGHYAADASTQSGTWLEEQQELALSATAQAARPIMPSRKSQRISTAVNTSDLPVDPQSAPRSPVKDTVVDEASRLLGISWSRMDQTESTQISQRAYTRWIERHYPQLNDIELWSENSAIEAYLGRAVNASTGAEEYYLWSHDLQQAVLVTRDPSELVLKLGQPQALLAGSAERLAALSQPVAPVAASSSTDMEID